MEQTQPYWWQREVIYQIYPRSFQDSNGDGIGDLNGIRSRLSYLKELGIGVIWISPIYPSPMADFGYDISDYTNVHPMFGTLADFDLLLQEVHALDMKLILDLVPNHTSHLHPWFIESRSSKTNPKRDWYLWHDAKPDGSPPNNWLGCFGGSAWEWDDQTKQYYYHAFLKEQPDLNWRNPQVQKAMSDVMRFWLDKGVDGFRVDVMWHMIKDKELRDNPVNPDYQPHQGDYEKLLPVYSTDQPEVHDIVRKMRSLLEEYQERVLIGEIYLPIHRLVTYYGADNRGAHLPFNFQLISLPWISQQISSAITEYEGSLPKQGWPNWVLGNHDQPRIASRVGIQQARIAAMLLLTLRGTPTIYYGEELGMRDVPIPFDKVKDPQGLNMPDKNLTRDPARTPMQWDASVNAGFSIAEPWLPLDRNFIHINVAVQKMNEDSMYGLYHRLLQLRRKEQALQSGMYKFVFSDRQVLAYMRTLEGSDHFLIVLNLTPRICYFRSPNSFEGTIILATHREIEGMKVKDAFTLSGDEGVIIRLTVGLS
jgi:alpha-glucosidase